MAKKKLNIKVKPKLPKAGNGLNTPTDSLNAYNKSREQLNGYIEKPTYNNLYEDSFLQKPIGWQENYYYKIKPNEGDRFEIDSGTYYNPNIQPDSMAIVKQSDRGYRDLGDHSVKNIPLYPKPIQRKGNGGIADPRQDSYYTPSSSDKKNEWEIVQDEAGSINNPKQLPEVEISAKRGDGYKNPMRHPTDIGSSADLLSDLFVTPLTEALHIPSRLVNQGIGLIKGNNPNYDSEISQTLGLKHSGNDGLYEGFRDFAVDNAADVIVPMAPEASVKFAKNRALNIIGQHPGHARSFTDILEGTLLNNKREYFGNWGVPERDVYGYGKRDLPNLLIHGDETGFTPIKYSDSGMNPEYKTYQMNSGVKHGQPLKWQELANEIKGSNPEFEFHQDFTKDPERFKEMMKELAEAKGDKGVIKFDIRPNADYKGLRLSNNPIYPEDDVAGHMGFFDTNTMKWSSRDQWGFTPAYDVRYKTTPFQKLQRQAVEKIGKPFNLAQENPIDFSQIPKDYQARVVHNLDVTGQEYWNNLDKYKQKDYTELLKKDYVKSHKFKNLYKKDKREFGGNINTDWEIVQDNNEWELVK